MARIIMACLLAAALTLTAVCLTTAVDTVEVCGETCTDDSDCSENAACLCENDTCENSTCICTSGYYEDISTPGTCNKKKGLGERCGSDVHCEPMFSRCTAGICTCPDGQIHDKESGECTNAQHCPVQNSTYLYTPRTRLCHKVLVNCTGCTDIQSTCQADSINGTGLTEILDEFVDTLWYYGFYTTDDARILLSVDHRSNGAGNTSWFWPNGEAIAMVPPGGDSSPSNNSCLYMRYGGEGYKLEVNESCDLATTNIGCSIQLPRDFCPSGKDSYDRVWDLTKADTVATQPCPEGQEGIATRECTADGQFRRASYRNCSLKIVQDIKEQLANGSINATEALDKLAEDVVNASVILFISDLNTVQETLGTVVKLSENDTVNQEAADAFLTVADFLIGDDNVQAWEQSIEEEDRGAENVLETVDDFVEQISVTAVPDKPIRIVKDNLELEVKALEETNGTRSDIQFPPPRENLQNDTNKTNGEEEEETKSGLFLDQRAFAGVNVTSTSIVVYKNLSSRVSSTLVSKDVDEITVKKEETKINSAIVSLTLNPESPAKLEPKLKLNFVPFEAIQDGYSPVCTYWDVDLLEGKGAWSKEGCDLVASNETVVLCECDHLTNFALLISPVPASGEHDRVLRIISLVGCCISMLCLTITIFIYGYYWRYLKSDNAILTFVLCICLLVAYIVFIVGAEQTVNKAGCTAIAVLLHYLYLAVFFMMLAEGLHMMTKVMMVYDRTSYVKQLLIGAFIAPAVIVAVSAGASQLRGYGNENYCWLPPGQGVFWAFAGPVLAIILANIIITVVVFRKLFSTSSMKNKEFNEKIKLTAWTLCVLVPIMGVTWLFGIFSVSKDQVAWQYVFVVLNTMQGAGIFIFHCVLNKQLRTAMKAHRERKRTLEDFTSELKKRPGAAKLTEHTSNTAGASSSTDFSTLKSDKKA